MAASNDTSGHVTANGVSLYYEIHGSGQPLILIEGLGVATWLWQKQIPDFSQHFRTIAYDNRGVGRSEKPEGPYSITMLADDLAGLMQALKIDSAHILGVSMGGFIAIDFALRFPDMVDRLVLVSTSAGGADHVPMSQESMAVFMYNEGSPREVLRHRMTLAYTDSFMQKPEFEGLLDLRLDDPQPPHGFQAQVAAGISFDRSNDAQKIDAPTLILAADDDPLVPVVNAKNLNTKIPKSKLKIYPNSKHQFFVQEWRKFNRDVIEFLTQ